MGSINSRAKGASGEREFCRVLTDLLGDALTEPLKRNLEQTRNGGHDILGIQAFALEIKRYKRIKDGDIKKFWEQACEQAERAGGYPALAFREDLQSWRVRVPMDVLYKDMSENFDLAYTVELSVEGFAFVLRELHNATLLHEQATPA